MDIRQLKAFVEIADAGTFTAGALRVHVTQAAISMQIRQLEEEVGTPLFIRAPRGVILTAAGERLLERARRILREHEAAVAEMTEMAGAEHGRLRLGTASAMVSTDPLPQILQQLHLRHAQAEVTLVSGTSESLVELILAGKLDMAFVSLPVETPGIGTEVLTRDELVAIASPRHKLAKGRVISAYTLAGEKLILGERGGNTRRIIDQFFHEAGVQPTVTMELSRLAAINRMVEADLGVGIVPLQSIRKEVADKRLVAWWIEGARINWELGLARLNGGYESPISQTFTILCREFFNAETSPAPRQKQGRTKSKQAPRIKR